MEFVSSFKYLSFYFSKERGPLVDMKMRVGERLKTFGAQIMFIFRCVSLVLNKELHGRVL